MRRSDQLPSLLGSVSPAPTTGRDAAIVERAVARDTALVRGKAKVVEARGRAHTRAIEEVASDAMFAGTNVSRQAVTLATICPVAEPMLRTIMEHSSMALGRIVADAARDLRD